MIFFSDDLISTDEKFRSDPIPNARLVLVPFTQKQHQTNVRAKNFFAWNDVYLETNFPILRSCAKWTGFVYWLSLTQRIYQRVEVKICLWAVAFHKFNYTNNVPRKDVNVSECMLQKGMFECSIHTLLQLTLLKPWTFLPQIGVQNNMHVCYGWSWMWYEKAHPHFRSGGMLEFYYRANFQSTAF